MKQAQKLTLKNKAQDTEDSQGTRGRDKNAVSIE